jgi:hypothetical protein
MFDRLKTFISSLKWHFQLFKSTWSWVLTLGAFAAFLMCAYVIALSATLLGLIPLGAMLLFALYLVDKNQRNKGKLDRLGETQITTERQEEAINDYVNMPSVKKTIEERERDPENDLQDHRKAEEEKG